MFGYGDKNATVMIVDFAVSQTQDSKNDYYNSRSGMILKEAPIIFFLN
jgi:hypothetical protein